MNLDPFNEFNNLSKRQETQVDYLKRVRSSIDQRISDEDIMVGYDCGLDVESIALELIKKLDSEKK